MKRITSLLLILFMFVGSAQAAIITDFTGGYDVSNWTQVLGGGSINLSGAPYSILEISSDAGNCCGANTDFTIAALGSGLVTFSWAFSTADIDGPSFDPFGYLLNGAFTQLTNNNGATSQSGTNSFSVLTGDIFGFRAHSTDSCCGAASTTISNFSAPATVPEPLSLVLMGLGLAGLGFSRKRG